MALVLDTSTASIAWKTVNASAGVEIGRHFVVLHCTSGANLRAGDTTPAGKVRRDDAMKMEASVFLAATANEFDRGDRDYGMVQVTELYSYEFLYAGRLESEGSTRIKMLSGFSRNPSLDVEATGGQTIDEHIFDSSHVITDRVTTPRTGFNIKMSFGDHPHNTVPLQFDNTLTKAQNFIASINRSQHFVVYFLTRATPTSPITILGRLGWAVTWEAEFKWKVATMKPTKTVKRSHLFPGTFVIGPPIPADAWSKIAEEQTTPTTNDQDKSAVDTAWTNHQKPVCDQQGSRPASIGADFFS